MKIYSKTGDYGSTGLVGGERIPKSSLRIAAIGEVDELNAHLGAARRLSPDDSILAQAQSWLFEVGAELASPIGEKAHRTIDGSQTAVLERSIDEIWQSLPPLKNFILPGGTELAVQLHLGRTVCRRAERSVSALRELDPISEELSIFLNRLSDWLFAAARKANADENIPDTIWQKVETPK